MVKAVRAQLCERAKDTGWKLTSEIASHLVVDGQRVDPVVRGLTVRFHVPAEANDVWLVSPTARPSETMGIWDDRDLGLYIAALRIEDGLSPPRDVAIDDPRLCLGFHATEAGVRWTAGRTRLPRELWHGYESGFYLRIELARPPVPRWVPSIAASSVESRPALTLVA